MSFEVPPRIGHASPDSKLLSRIRRNFVESAAPIRPLPSNLTIMGLLVAVFIVLAILFAAPLRFYGFTKLSALDRVAEYAVVILLALVLAGGVVEQMIPGSRRTLRPGVSVILAVLLLSFSASLLFPVFDMTNFVSGGVPCLRLGILCSVPGAGLTTLVMRRGLITDPVPATVAAAALSGLLGVGVLSLHCPNLSASHIIAWHVGVLVVTSLAGAFLAWIVQLFTF